MAVNNKKKNQFSIYWIYGFIAVAIIGGFQLFNSSDTSSIVENQKSFFDLAEKGFVAHVFIVNNVNADFNRADFKLTKEGKDFVLNSTKGELAKMGKAFKNESRLKNSDPTFKMGLLSARNFENNIKKINENLIKEHKNEILYEPKTEVHLWGSISSYLLPIVIIVSILIFLKRRMGRRARGDGEQNFNIGKSKAKIYEKSYIKTKIIYIGATLIIISIACFLFFYIYNNSTAKTILIPKNFKGNLRVIYEEKCGGVYEKKEGVTTLTFPDNGILILNEDFDSHDNYKYYLVDELGNKTEIPRLNYFQDRVQKRPCVLSGGYGTINYLSKEISYKDFYVYNKDNNGNDFKEKVFDSLTVVIVNQCRQQKNTLKGKNNSIGTKKMDIKDSLTKSDCLRLYGTAPDMSAWELAQAECMLQQNDYKTACDCMVILSK
jgi:hypothetical protein